MRRHFHTFDALRFFAFFKVFLLHLPIAAFPVFNYLKSGGGIGVIFFFVLSGFLISYIILTEKKLNNKINLRKFFIRRILRIWPLYYLMILVAYITPFIISYLGLSASPDGYGPNWLMSALFLENYKIIVTGDHPNVSPLGVMWSLCIEEHFYIIWGIAFFFISIKKIPVFLFTTIVLANISRIIFSFYNIPFSDILTNIDYFAYGAFPAYFLATQENKFEKAITDVPSKVKFIFIITTIAYVIISPNINYTYQRFIEPAIFGLLFSIIIMIIIPVENNFKISNKNILSRLGVFTYGLYLYHTIIINLLKQLSDMVQFRLDIPVNALAFSIAALAATIIVSIPSYHLFEKQFLKLKKRFY